jgi:ribosomal protein L17
MALAYQHLENQVVDSKSFNWKQVCNLPLQGLPKHFRLNIDNADEIKFPDFLENFTKQLLDEEGIETTLDRLSRLPYKFSEQIIEEFKLLSLDRKKELADRFRGDWRSPLGRLHYFMLVLSVFGNNDEFINKVREDVEFVFNSKEGKLEFEIFQVVLRLVYNEITSRTPSKTWSHEMKLILTWGHASKVFNLILLSEKDISEHEKLLNYIKNYINFCLHEIFDFNSILWTDCLHPRLFEGFTFYSFSTCSLFKDIPFELIEKTNLSKYLEPILFNQKDDVLYPQDLFLKVLNNRTNITSSILFSNKLEEYDWFCSGKTIVIIPSEAILDYFSSILEDLRKNYLDEEKWFYISFWLEDINLTDLFAKKYQLIIEAIDIEKIWEINPQLVQQILFFTTKQKEILSESLKQKVANWIKQITLKLAEKFPYHPTQSVAEEIDDWVFFISNTVIQWSIENNNPLISSLKYNDLIFELAYAWHYLPIRLENLFYRLWLNLPVEHNQNVGKNILLARALK